MTWEEELVAATDREPPEMGRGSGPFRVTILLSSSFCLVFMAFSSAQNFQTSRSASEGSRTLAILYGVFTVSNLLSPPMIRVLAIK